jgi:preprotein translocase subunit YajC
MKGTSANKTIIAVAILVVVAMFGAMFYMTSFQSKQTAKDQGESIGEALKQSFSKADVEFKFNAIDGSAQDNDSDLDIDCFYYDPTVADDLDVSGMGDNKGYLDCSDTKPLELTGEELVANLAEDNFCKVNIYKFWRDTNFNAGDSETKIDDYLDNIAADIDPIDGTGGTEQITSIVANKEVICTALEGATTDDEDVVPFAFMFKIVPAKLGEQMASDINDGTTNMQIKYKYYSDAAAHSKVTIDGEFEDSEGNTGTLDSGLAGEIDSSLTTATAIDLDGNIFVSVDKNGYAMPLINELASSDIEKAYLAIDPYGEGVNASGLSSAWEEYGSGDLTGDVGYGTTVTASVDQIIWMGFAVCGATITDSSTVDAVVHGTEPLYEPSCFVSSSTDVNAMKGLFDKEGVLTIPFSVDYLTVDYDAATNSTDGQLDYASGSSPEVIADINLYTLESSSDRIAQTLG